MSVFCLCVHFRHSLRRRLVPVNIIKLMTHFEVINKKADSTCCCLNEQTIHRLTYAYNKTKTLSKSMDNLCRSLLMFIIKWHIIFSI